MVEEIFSRIPETIDFFGNQKLCFLSEKKDLTEINIVEIITMLVLFVNSLDGNNCYHP